MEKERKKQIIKLCVAIIAFAIIIILVATVMIRYEVEGDKNLPFNLSKIILISTAEGNENKKDEEKSDKRWSFDVEQNNDMYLYIDKNENYHGDEKTIKSVVIENINITQAPQKGEIKVYMPNSTKGRVFENSEDYLVEEKLEYKGATESNPQTLEIGRNGGSSLIRFSNVGIGKYTSNKDKEITHDGTLLNKVKVTNDEAKFNVSFDLVITVENFKYRANISMQMPCGDITEEGTCSLEKTDMSDVIFKRERL